MVFMRTYKTIPKLFCILYHKVRAIFKVTISYNQMLNFTDSTWQKTAVTPLLSLAALHELLITDWIVLTYLELFYKRFKSLANSFFNKNTFFKSKFTVNVNAQVFL